jgi:uncharacterized membrane protein YkoI
MHNGLRFLLTAAALIVLVSCEHAPCPPWRNFTSAGSPALSLADAMQAAERSTGGRAMSGELERENGRALYEVAVLEGGGVMLDVEIDGNTGEVLEIEPQDNE